MVLEFNIQRLVVQHDLQFFELIFSHSAGRMLVTFRFHHQGANLICALISLLAPSSIFAGVFLSDYMLLFDVL
jgi:hypothetical protein